MNLLIKRHKWSWLIGQAAVPPYAKNAVHGMRAVQWQGHEPGVFWYDVHFKLDVLASFVFEKMLFFTYIE